MVQRLLQSRLARGAFVAIAVALAVWAVVRYRLEVQAAAADLSLPAVALGLISIVVGIGLTLLSWRRLLAELGSPLPLPAAIRVFSLAQLGKYIPGSIWPFVAQVELGREHGVPRRRSTTAGLLIIVISLVSAMIVAAVTLPFAAQDAARSYWWALAIAPLLAAGLHPAVLNPALDLVLRLARRPPLEVALSGRGVLAVAGWTIAAWAVFGVHVWLFARDLGGDTALLPLAAVGSFALAWAAGLVVIIAPAGAGVREVVLALGLASVLDQGSVVLLVIASRLLMTVGDLGWAAFGVLLGRRHVPRIPGAIDEALAMQRAREAGS